MQTIKEMGADEAYTTPVAGAGPTYENLKAVVAAKRRLYDLYAFNNSAGLVYVAVMDTATAAGDITTTKIILPVLAGSYDSWSVTGGRRFAAGIVLKAFTDVALQVPAGNVMFYHAGYRAYH